MWTSLSAPVPSPTPPETVTRPRRPGPPSAGMVRTNVPSVPVATVSWTAREKKDGVPSGPAPSPMPPVTVTKPRRPGPPSAGMVRENVPSARAVMTTAGLSARTASVPGTSTTVTATKARTPGSVPAPLPASMTNRTRLPAVTSAVPTATVSASPVSGRMRTSPSGPVPSPMPPVTVTRPRRPGPPSAGMVKTNVPSVPMATASWIVMEKKEGGPSARAVTTTAGLSARTASVPGTSTTATATKARTDRNAVRPSPASMTSRTVRPGATSAAPNVMVSASPVSGRMRTSPSAKTRSAGTASPPSAPDAGTGALTARR